MGMFLTTSKKVAFRIASSMVALVFLFMGMLSVVCFNEIDLLNESLQSPTKPKSPGGSATISSPGSARLGPRSLAAGQVFHSLPVDAHLREVREGHVVHGDV